MTKEDYKAALETTRNLFSELQKENEALIKENSKLKQALEYYANSSNIRDIVLFDCGRMAREMLTVKYHY